MKKRILISSLSLIPLLVLILVIGFRPLPIVGEKEPETPRSLRAELIMTAVGHPLLRPWLDQAVQVLQDNPGLASYWSSYYLDRAMDIGPQGPVEPEPFVLTFPHTANGSAGPGQASLVSSVLLLNNGGANATGSVTFRQTNGTPLVLNTSLGVGSQFDFELLSGEELRLVTDGSGMTQQGWVEVVSDVRISGSGLFTVLDAQGAFVSEVGIGDSVRSTSLMVFVDTTNGKSTGVGIANPNAAEPANLTYTLKGLDGQQIAQSGPDQLGPLNQKAFFVVQAFPEINLTDFKGVLLIESDVPVAVVTLRTRGLNFTSLPAVSEAIDLDEDEYTLYFARIGDGVFGQQEFVTSILLLNNSALEVAGTVELFQANGTPLRLVLNGDRGSSFDVNVPAGGALELVSDGSIDPGVVGWIRVRSDEPLDGGATFVINTSSGEFISEVGIANSPLEPKPALVVRVGDGVSTGFALTNPHDLDVVANLRLIGNTFSGASPAGEGMQPPEIIAESTLSIGPRGHEGLFVSQVFPDVPAVQAQDFQGRLEIEVYAPSIGESTLAPVTGLTLFLRNSPAGTFLTSAPLALYEVNFGPVTKFVPATRMAGSEPSFCLETRQLVGERILDTAVFTIESVSMDFSEVQDSVINGKSYTRVLFFPLAANAFMTESTPERALFFAPISLDGVSESNPSWNSITNLEEGGIQVVVVHNATGEEPVEIPFESGICFNSKLLQLPDLPGDVLVTEQYRSLDLDPSDGGPFESIRYSLVRLDPMPAGAPRIESANLLQVVGGQEVILNGSFTFGAGNNTVTVEGNSRVEAEVLSASTSQLRVRLPHGVTSGPLRVESEGMISNDYQLDVLFSPTSQVSFSGSPGSNANLTLEVRQHRDEILFTAVSLTASQGEWITSGFSEGENVGSMLFAGIDGNETMLDMLVSATEQGSVTFQAVEPGADDPAFEIQVSGGANPGLTLIAIDELGLTVLAPVETRTTLQTTRPIFKRPAGSFNVMLDLTSQPERVFFPGTAVTIHQTHAQ